MNVLKIILSVAAIIYFNFCLVSCSDNIRSQFDSCYAGKSNSNDLLSDNSIKKRIIRDYSQQYYEKLLEIGKIYSSVYYDSIQNIYHLYMWKEQKFRSDNSARLRYYVNKDSIGINLIVNQLEIDKSGYSDYAGWEDNAKLYVEAITKKANQGNATAQLILGIYYSDGIGVDKNEQKALQWLGKAAQQNLSTAQYILGLFYETGKGIEKNEKKCLEWITKASEQELLGAMEYLANLYIKGEKVDKDYSKALSLYLNAAKQHTNYQYLLGNIYWNSEIVSPDKLESIRWFTLAANNNNLEAQITLGNLYMNGEEITKDYAKSLHWFTKAAEQGDSDTQYLLACIYMQDKISFVIGNLPHDKFKEMVKPDYEQGVMWLRKSAEQGNLAAQRSLGIYCYKVEGNKDEARKWFDKVAEQGDDSWLMFADVYL